MMPNKTVVVTGANSGIGYALALQFAGRGDRLIMACRNPEKAGAARRDILAAAPSADVRVILCDLSDLDSIREFARQFTEQVGYLDILVNNAGIVGEELERNQRGHEMQLATNYLGPFALTGLLLPLCNKEGEARIVTVGSLSHRFTRFDLDNINFTNEADYTPMKGYARSKLATMAFTLELERRLRASGSNVVSIGAHPGFAATAITRKHGEPEGNFRRWYQDRMKRLVPTPARASIPAFFAATSGQARGADYFGPRGLAETGLFQRNHEPQHAKINPAAKGVDDGTRLWELSEQMSGVSFLSSY